MTHSDKRAFCPDNTRYTTSSTATWGLLMSTHQWEENFTNEKQKLFGAL